MMIEDKLNSLLFVSDKEPHIRVNKEVCGKCLDRPCINCCPAGCYTYEEDSGLTFSYEGCLECGVCRIICEHGAIDWSYPTGGFGVCYRR